MNIKNKFFDLEFLNTEIIEESKEILKNTFLIDFYNLENLFNKEDLEELYGSKCSALNNKKEIKEYLSWKKKFIPNSLKEISLNQNIDNILLEIHKICIYILGDYNVSIKEYFPDAEEKLNTENIIPKYLFNNIKNNICLFQEFEQSKDKEQNYNDEFLRIDALKEYMASLSVKEINKIYKNLSSKSENGDPIKECEENILENKNRNFSRNIKYLNTNSDTWKQIQNVFLNEEEQPKHKKHCYKLTSNVYMYLIDNYRKCRLLFNENDYNEFCDLARKVDEKENNNELEKKELKKKETKINSILKAHTYENIIDYINGFINHKIRLTDLYYFERINNNYFILELYTILTQIINESNERINMYEYLYCIAYLPNIFENSDFIISLVNDYKSNNYYKNKAKFEDGVKKLCLDLSFLIIPLYNMIFANVLNYYCKVKKIEVRNIVERYCNKNKRNLIKKHKKEYLLDKKENLLKLYNKEEFQFMSILLNKKMNFNIFDQNNTIKNIRIFNENFVDERVNTAQIQVYRKAIKKFISEIIQINLQ